VTQSGGAPNANDSHAGHYATLRDAELILAMRRYEQEAFVEFIERHRILVWNHARDLGVAAPERRSWSEEVLHDCALALVREGARIPANLPGYIIVSARRKFFAQLRSASDDETFDELVEEELDCRSTVEEEEAANSLPEPVLRLLDRLTTSLTADEELLLVWKGHHVPYSTIAEWLGETRSAVAQRIWRLTKRVSEAAEQIIAPFSSADQEAVRRFLHVRKEDRNETS